MSESVINRFLLMYRREVHQSPLWVMHYNPGYGIVYAHVAQCNTLQHWRIVGERRWLNALRWYVGNCGQCTRGVCAHHTMMRSDKVARVTLYRCTAS